jgi:hypothetical protein
MKKKQQQAASFVIPALLDLQLHRHKQFNRKEPVLMSIIWTRQLNLVTTFPICKRNMVRQY